MLCSSGGASSCARTLQSLDVRNRLLPCRSALELLCQVLFSEKRVCVPSGLAVQANLRLLTFSVLLYALRWTCPRAWSPLPIHEAAP